MKVLALLALLVTLLSLTVEAAPQTPEAREVPASEDRYLATSTCRLTKDRTMGS